MKKISITVILALLVSLFFSTASLVAGAAAPDKPRTTPGAKPTDRVVQHARPGNGDHGNGQGGGDHGNGNNGNNDDNVNNGNGDDHGNGPKNTPGAKATEKADERATPDPSQPRGQRVTYRGIVLAVGGGLTLSLADGGSQSFLVNSATRIHIPTLEGNATLADVAVGAPALVQVLAGDASMTALYITVVPGKPEPVHRVGLVTAYTPGASITVQDKSGQSSTFVLTPDTKILPAQRASQLGVGSLVTIISRRDPAGGPLTAQGIVVHPQTNAATATATPTQTPTATQTLAPSDTPTETATPTETPTETATP